ncbi:MAG: L-rhamnose mutarotase [Kiritimatiellia bacterium]
MKRVGMVVRLKPECVEEYRRLHAASSPGVRDLLTKYHLHNFSIFLHQIGEDWFEFGYYEYTGNDFKADMAALAAEPRNQAWLEVCDPMQLPLEGAQVWTEMECVYHNG